MPFFCCCKLAYIRLQIILYGNGKKQQIHIDRKLSI